MTTKSKFLKLGAGDTKIRFLPPVSADSPDFPPRHYIPASGPVAVPCPVPKLRHMVNVPVLGSAIQGGMTRSAAKSLSFGQRYGIATVHDSILISKTQAGFVMQMKAPLRKRPKRIEKKLETRAGFATYPRTLAARNFTEVLQEMDVVFRDASTRRSASFAEQRAFDARSDVKATREDMIRRGVPREERKKVYRVLRKALLKDE